MVTSLREEFTDLTGQLIKLQHRSERILYPRVSHNQVAQTFVSQLWEDLEAAKQTIGRAVDALAMGEDA